jgi:hypothetical protein
VRNVEVLSDSCLVEVANVIANIYRLRTQFMPLFLTLHTVPHTDTELQVFEVKEVHVLLLELAPSENMDFAEILLLCSC